MFGGRDDRRGGNPIAMLAVTLLAPIAASLIQMAVSRSREYEADRGAAELVGSGESLATALEKIEYTSPSNVRWRSRPPRPRHYIHNPLAEAHSRSGDGGGMAKLFSTHPPTQERIRRLRSM